MATLRLQQHSLEEVIKWFYAFTMGVVVLVAFASPVSAKAQENSRDGVDIEVQRVRRVTHVYVQLEVKNLSAKTLFIPTCGRMNGDELLCDLAVRLEIGSSDRWQPAPEKCNCSVLGGVRTEDSVELAPGSSRPFLYAVPIERFKMKHGQHARLRLEAWPDARIFTKQTAETLYTPSFAMP